MTLTKFSIFLIVITSLLGGTVVYKKYTSEYKTVNTSYNFKALYFHKKDDYSIAVSKDNILTFERIILNEGLKLIIQEDLSENEEYRIDYDYQYSKWNGFNKNYDNKIIIHIRKDTQIQGAEFTYGKNLTGTTSLISG